MAELVQRKEYPIVQLAKDTLPEPVTDEVDANTTYVGYADLGTADTDKRWHIKRILKTGTETRVEYPNGSMEYAFAWADHLTLTYAR